MFSNNKPYKTDLPLFSKLGFSPFELPIWKEHFLGEVKLHDLDGSYVKVWVECAPAQFFRAEIYCGETETLTRVKTGSGTLSEYWPMFKAMAEGCFVITEVSHERK